MRRKNSSRVCAGLMILMLSILVSGCGYTEQPPKAAEPEAAPHQGTYTSEQCGSMAFNGDGQTIEIQFFGPMAEEYGLDEEIHEGTYHFSFSNGAYRYDYAENLEIDVDGKNISFLNNHVGINDVRPTSFELISVTVAIEGVDDVVYFERVSDESGLASR